jgi:hypothetical protein
MSPNAPESHSFDEARSPMGLQVRCALTTTGYQSVDMQILAQFWIDCKVLIAIPKRHKPSRHFVSRVCLMGNVSLAGFAPLAILLPVCAPYFAVASLVFVFEIVCHGLS